MRLEIEPSVVTTTTGDGNAVLLVQRTGRVYRLNRTASAFLAALRDADRRLDDARRALTSARPIETCDLDLLIFRLTEIQAIRRVP